LHNSRRRLSRFRFPVLYDGRKKKEERTGGRREDTQSAVFYVLRCLRKKKGGEGGRGGKEENRVYAYSPRLALAIQKKRGKGEERNDYDCMKEEKREERRSRRD